jgi:hypothetical protein
MEIGHPTTNTLPTRMISKNPDPVAKRKKNSSIPSARRELQLHGNHQYPRDRSRALRIQSRIEHPKWLVPPCLFAVTSVHSVVKDLV